MFHIFIIVRKTAVFIPIIHYRTRVPGFSNCNMEGLKKINDKCLYNVPTKVQKTIKENCLFILK